MSEIDDSGEQDSLEESKNSFLGAALDQAPEKAHHLAMLVKVVERFYMRGFFKLLILWYIRTLKEETKAVPWRKKQVVADWPFKSLFFKRNRTPQEELMLQFVQVCAEKIQARFKGYITRKRHLQALRYLKKHLARIRALVVGLKTRRIYSCIAIRLIRDKAAAVQREINTETFDSKLSREGRRRKIQYLQREGKLAAQSFQNKFAQFFETGNWVFEIDRSIVRKHRILLQNRSIMDKAHQQTGAEKKRVREFPRNQLQHKTQKQDEKVQKIIENIIQSKKVESFPFSSNSVTDEDRPIQAKGAYELNDDILSKAQKMTQQAQAGQEEKRQQRKVHKSRMEKRLKYDPRKAVLEAKKKQEEILKKDDIIVEEPTQSKKVEENRQNSCSQRSLSITQNKSAVNREKKQKEKSQGIGINKSTVLPSKKQHSSKVEPKIDCWSSKVIGKKGVIPVRDKHQQKHRLRHEAVQDFDSVRERNTRQTEQADTSEPSHDTSTNDRFHHQISHEVDKKMPLISECLLNRKMRNINAGQIVENYRPEEKPQEGKLGAAGIINEQARLKYEQLNNLLKKMHQRQPENVNQRQHETIRARQPQAQPKQAAITRRENAHPLQRLEEAYSNQYMNKLHNLKPKLALLAVARKSDSEESIIPVMPENSPGVNKFLKEYSRTLAFWDYDAKMRHRYRQCINS